VNDASAASSAIRRSRVRLGSGVRRVALGSTLAAARGALRRGFARVRPRRSRPELSVIICSVDDRRFAQCDANWRDRLQGRRYELIRIRDARSLAEGYNRGLARSRGERLVFCHDDIELLQPDVYERIVAHLRCADVAGVAGSSRLLSGLWSGSGQPDTHGQVVSPAPNGDGFHLDVFGFASQAAGKAIQALDGLFLAVRRNVAEALRFDAESFDGFHLYDADFTFRAYLAGFHLAVCHDILIYHASLGDYDEAWKRYAEVFRRKYADRLSTAPAGDEVRLRFWMRDKSEALALFEQVARQQGPIEADAATPPAASA